MATRRIAGPVRSRKQWERLSAREQETYERVLDAVALGRREGLSARAAAKRVGTTVRSMKRYGGDAVERSGRRMVVADADRLFRRMRVQTTGGRRAGDVRGSRVASRVAAHHAAVDGYLKGGGEERLRRFRRTRVGGYEL